MEGNEGGSVGSVGDLKKKVFACIAFIYIPKTITLSKGKKI